MAAEEGFGGSVQEGAETEGPAQKRTATGAGKPQARAAPGSGADAEFGDAGANTATTTTTTRDQLEKRWASRLFGVLRKALRNAAAVQREREGRSRSTADCLARWPYGTGQARAASTVDWYAWASTRTCLHALGCKESARQPA